MMWGNLFYLVLGSLVGSFLNVCIRRIPAGESIIRPRSHCPHCKTQLPFYDLIPVLNFFWLKGQCRFCKSPISKEYPVVEILTAVVSVFVLGKFGFTIQGGIYFLFAAALIVVTFIDLHHRIIPDSISIGGTVIGFVLSFYFLNITALESLIGILFGGGILFLLAFFYFKLTKREGMGGGDIKLAAMIGAFLGYKAVFLTLFLSSILGTLWGLSTVILKRQSLQTALPFGPFLAAAAVLILFFQNDLLLFLGLGY